MNKYGYFVYEDYPLNAEFTYQTSYQVQTDSDPIQNGIANSGAIDWTTFEAKSKKNLYDTFLPLGSLFDFNRVLYTQHEAEPGNHLMPNVSVDASDKDGYFGNPMQVTFTPDAAYSGSGFALKTFNDYYEIRITVTDEDGTRSKTFERNDDEFYPFIFNGVQSVIVRFLRIKPYSFIKFIAFQFGTIRSFSERDLIGEPTIVNHYSHTGENLEYDTLDLTIRGNKEELNIITGERLTYTTTGQQFYVETATYNNDGTIDITAYDSIALLEGDFLGVYAKTGTAESWIRQALQGDNGTVINVENLFVSEGTQTFSGMLGIIPYKEAAQKLMLGNGVRLRRKNNTYNIFVPHKDFDITANFNEHNIVNGTPTVEELERYGTVRFLKHYYNLNKSGDRVEAFNGLVDIGESTITFSDAFSSLQYYYVSGTDSQGDDILTPVQTSKFIVLEQQSARPHYIKVNNSYTQRIVVVGYPYNESHYGMEYVDSSIPIVYKNNKVNITDCTVMVNLDNYTGFMFGGLAFTYQANKRISFDSVLDATAGDHCQIEFDGKQFEGWITQKKDHMNGLYEYEVMCF